MEKAVEASKLCFIGLSNFDEHLDEILNICKIKPAVLQVECHPYWNQDDLRNKLKVMVLLLKVGILLVMEIKI